MYKIFLFIMVLMIVMGAISCSSSPLLITSPVITEVDSLPRGRGGHAAAVLNGHVFVAGGTDWSADRSKKFWLDDSIVLINGLWQPGPALPHPVAYSLFAYNETGVYLAGGTDGSVNLKTVYHLADHNSSWNTLKPLPMALCSGCGALLNNKLYVTCGWTDQGSTNQMWALDLNKADADWLPCQTLPGSKRAFPALVACGGYLYLFGGMSPDPNGSSLGVQQDAYRYNPEKDLWTKLKDLPWPGYAWSGVSIDENHIMLTGKADGEVHKEIYLLNIRDMTTRQIGETIIQSTTAPLIKVKPNEYWFIAGEPDSKKNRTNRITSIKLLAPTKEL